MTTLKKAINPSLNTNPFNHNTYYLKLYTSVKDDISGKDEYGQLINTKYLDDVFNFATNSLQVVRKVRVSIDRKEYLHMPEVQVLDYTGTNVALGKTATQSSTFSSGYSASNAVDNNFVTISHTNNDVSKYHISLQFSFPKYHVSL